MRGKCEVGVKGGWDVREGEVCWERMVSIGYVSGTAEGQCGGRGEDPGEGVRAVGNLCRRV